MQTPQESSALTGWQAVPVQVRAQRGGGGLLDGRRVVARRRQEV
jgi:hypothetical protein